MSQSDKEISKVCGPVDDADEDDQEVGGGAGGGGVHGNDDGKEGGCSSGFICTKNFRKAKQVVLFPLAKAKKQLDNRRKRLHHDKSLSSAANAGLSGNGFRDTGTKGCSFCFTQPQTSESPAESHRSDPNDPSFSYEMLKSLIEKNDFYSKECNPHLDFHDRRSSNATG